MLPTLETEEGAGGQERPGPHTPRAPLGLLSGASPAHMLTLASETLCIFGGPGLPSCTFQAPGAGVGARLSW